MSHDPGSPQVTHYHIPTRPPTVDEAVLELTLSYRRLSAAIQDPQSVSRASMAYDLSTAALALARALEADRG